MRPQVEAVARDGVHHTRMRYPDATARTYPVVLIAIYRAMAGVLLGRFWVPEVVRLFFRWLRFCVWGPATFMKTENMG
jgi:hypothetical protein